MSTEIPIQRQRDALFLPEGDVWTTECLLPRGLCPNTSPNIDHIRYDKACWTSPERSAWHTNRMAMIVNRLPGRPKPSRIIDYGTYYGEVASKFKELWPDADVYAMDCAEAYLQAVREYAPDVIPTLTRPGHLDFPSGRVDIIILADVAEHLYEDEWLAVLKDAYVALRPGGQFLCHCPVGDELVGKPLYEIVTHFMTELRHPSLKSTTYIRDTVRDAGFDVRLWGRCFEIPAWGWIEAVKPE